MANARSLGATVFRADSAGSLVTALAAARAEKAPCLIYVPVTPHSAMKGYAWWDVPPAEVSGVASVRAARAAYDRARRRQRYLA